MKRAEQGEQESAGAVLRHDVTGLGETMIRLSVPVGERLQAAARLELHVGGAESNVLGVLARLGHRAAWVSSLPDNSLGRLVADALRTAGVDLSPVVWREGGRVGTYFIEYTLAPLATSVIYDRARSCLAELDAAEVDWEGALSTRLLHLTGITPALSPQAYALAARAADEARARSIPFSFDVNFRARLWSAEEAGEALPGLARGAALLFCAERDAQMLWGLAGDAAAICAGLHRIFAAEAVVLTVGDQGAWLSHNGQVVHQPAFPTHMVDRIGAGDALASGVIDGWLRGDLHAGLQTGALLAALAASQYGDMLITTRAEVESLLVAGGAPVLR